MRASAAALVLLGLVAATSACVSREAERPRPPVALSVNDIVARHGLRKRVQLEPVAGSASPRHSEYCDVLTSDTYTFDERRGGLRSYFPFKARVRLGAGKGGRDAILPAADAFAGRHFEGGRKRLSDMRRTVTVVEAHDRSSYDVWYREYAGDVRLPTYFAVEYDEASGAVLHFMQDVVDVTIPLKPTLTADEALRMAVKGTGYQPMALRVVELCVRMTDEGEQQLVWAVARNDHPGEFFVEAHTGEVIPP